MNKVFTDADAALFDVQEGAVILWRFGLCGNPENCIDALLRRGVRNLTIVSNNCGVDGRAWQAAAGRPGAQDDLVPMSARTRPSSACISTAS